MVRQPETRYAKGPEGNLAYQVVGDGPTDLVIVPGWSRTSTCSGAIQVGRRSSASWHHSRE